MKKVQAHSKPSKTVLSIFAALMALMLMAAPAFASHKDSHDPGSASAPAAGDRDGDADSDPATSYTEDNDTNDSAPNNVPDDGDNAHPSSKDRSIENGKSGTQGKSESDPDDDGRGPERSNGGPDKANGSGGVDKADQDGNNGCGNDDDFEDDNEGWCGKRPAKDDEVKGGNTPCDKDATMPGTQPCDKDDDDDEVEGDDSGKDKGKITICHATGSMTNPYVVITISVNGLSGHGDHEGDIIPAPAAGCTLPANVPNEVLLGTETPDVDVDGAGPETPDVDEDKVLGEVIEKDEDNVLGSEVAPEAAERGPRVLGAALPFTGASILSFLAASFALIAGGFAFTRTRRS
jgi:hypothetical protein